MKICLISFDYWDYDYHVVEALKRKGINTHHIDISTFKYTYKTPFHKIGNFLSKVFLNKNIKKIKRQEYVVDTLKSYGHQDYVLSIRPDLLDVKTHTAIKQQTNNYIAYIYDSCKRFPVDHLLDGIFDEIYSFDLDDVKKYGFKHIPNYIYLDKQPIKEIFEQDVFIVMTADERLQTLNKMAEFLDKNQISYKFMLIGKHKPKDLHPGITYQKEEIRPDALKSHFDNSRIFLDLIRHGHNGLSFRVFEALANQKKLITTNKTISEYDFYSPENIQIIGEDEIDIDPEFFKTPYQQLPDKVYHKFTIEKWVDTVFDLKN